MAAIIEDRDASSLGFFNLADSYWTSATALHDLKLRATHSHFPVKLLYHQTMELYLKSYLLLKGKTVAQIKGHRLVPLANKLKEFGFKYEQRDSVVFSLLDTSDVVTNSRYLRVDIYWEPAIADMELTCSWLRATIGAEFVKAGITIRATPSVPRPARN